ncbi:hypothetical protein DVH29_08610 [Pelagibacterium lacus]|uniref:Uncharacterized protein n=1 Tax=Pelagibacterium lacus TaxID=2282655 RepID=A0A369W397_9HYPH|nr:hypothetical protein DVH29_08610 [Pelagibacterium lacus]
MCSACGALGQEVPGTPEAPETPDQLQVDIDALVVAGTLSMRCALFDDSVDYLTPLEAVGADIRLSELIGLFAARSADAADVVAGLRGEAAAIACGDPRLATYMDFGRQVARDVIDVGMVAWQSIDVAACNYFADDDFMAAVARARAAAAAAEIAGPQNRVDYINRLAAGWVGLFADNCANLGFDPVETLPGAIALALPIE